MRKRRKDDQTTPLVYADIKPITAYIPPLKQAVKRHYGSHQYFTKRAWNVIQAYIDHFTQPGDVVCDPYGGTGVTVIEALVLGRKGIYLDISQWAKFLAEEIAVAPVDLGDLSMAFEKVAKACEHKINEWWKLPIDEVEKIPISRWYPKDYPLPKNADVEFVHELFTHRQLLALSELFHHVEKTKDEVQRNLLRYAFSATLYMCNRTFISAKGRLESRGGSSIFSIYRYKVAKKAVELNPWTIFSGRVKKLAEAKEDTNRALGRRAKNKPQSRFIHGYAQRLTKYVRPESVDYIFTDPPYGSHIAYLDLTRMWVAWLGFKITPEDQKAEAIEAGDLEHSVEHFKTTLAAGIAEMFRVLKYDRWMTLVFAHREPAIWDAIVKAAEAAGFEYVNTVPQPVSVVWSMHKKKNPLTVLSGELVLNFRKVRNPRTLAITTVGSSTVDIIKNSAELTIVQRRGATTDEVYTDLIPKLLENGLLGDVAGSIGDINPLLHQEFDYDKEHEKWHVKPGKKLGSHIPLDDRIRFYVTDYLNASARTGERATINSIVYHVLPKLKNGIQPTKQFILDELRKIAVPDQGKYWRFEKHPQQTLDFDPEPPPTGSDISDFIGTAKPEDDYEHNEILSILAKLGRAAGFECHVGKKEQAENWNGESMASLSVKSPPAFLRGASAFTKRGVEQIDLIWMDGGRPAWCLEIEHSTPMTTAFDRFIEALKVDNALAEHLVIVAPRSRQRKLDQVMNSTHYIGAPMYMDRKVRYLWYVDVLKIAARFERQQPTRAELAKAIADALHLPQA